MTSRATCQEAAKQQRFSVTAKQVLDSNQGPGTKVSVTHYQIIPEPSASPANILPNRTPLPVMESVNMPTNPRRVQLI